MAKFIYKLQSILNLKEKMEDQKKIELGNATTFLINQEDILIVLSDHGFSTFRRAVHVNAWLREKGYLKLT